MCDVYVFSDYEKRAESHRNAILNDHLDVISLTKEEEEELDMMVEDALNIMIDDRLPDIYDDECIEALIKNDTLFSNLFSTEIEEEFENATQQQIKNVYNRYAALVKAMEESMRESLRSVAEDKV